MSDTGAVAHGDIKRAFVSYPALFKHLAFDGGYLHGVPEQLMRTGDGRIDDGPSNDQLKEGGSTRHQVRSCAAASPSAGSGVNTSRVHTFMRISSRAKGGCCECAEAMNDFH